MKAGLQMADPIRQDVQILEEMAGQLDRLFGLGLRQDLFGMDREVAEPPYEMRPVPQTVRDGHLLDTPLQREGSWDVLVIDEQLDDTTAGDHRRGPVRIEQQPLGFAEGEAEQLRDRLMGERGRCRRVGALDRQERREIAVALQQGVGLHRFTEHQLGAAPDVQQRGMLAFGAGDQQFGRRLEAVGAIRQMIGADVEGRPLSSAAWARSFQIPN